MQLASCAFCLAFARAGKSIVARMAMMAMTTSDSIKVNARRKWSFDFIQFEKHNTLTAIAAMAHSGGAMAHVETGRAFRPLR